MTGSGHLNRSIPCDLITGIAIGPVGNLIRPSAASGAFDCALMPPTNAV
jgi:hypothetical protein